MYSYFKLEIFLFLLILGCIAFIPSRAEARKLSAQETYNQVAANRERGQDRNGWSWGASYDYDPYFYDEDRPYSYYDDPYYYEDGNNGNYNEGVRVRNNRR